jgi:hypothetical protein
VTETASPKAIEILATDQLLELDNGEVVATVGACDLVRDDGTESQPGDVLSVQEDGTYQTRPAGTDGPFERATKTPAGLIYRPKGPFGRTFLVGLTDTWPNP